MAASDANGRRRRAKKTDSVDLDQRKERVLHTRVPESLDRHLKTRARGLGLSVSTVVRNVLLNTFGLVEDIVTDSTNIALALTGEDPSADGVGRRRRENPPAGNHAPNDVVAWQEAVLNVNAVCEQCNTVLLKGARAAIGVRERPGPRSVLCPRCLDGVGVSPPEPKRKRRRASS
ncbi:MAG TPA: hypothetical protein VFO62_09625 [Candidatus Binatia bacterium]|nr:hypothetical protein [Candidatus Binatia bacterium]